MNSTRLNDAIVDIDLLAKITSYIVVKIVIVVIFVNQVTHVAVYSVAVSDMVL
jgi:hypothetical protein